MKITTKTTKEQLKSFLGANAKAVKTANKDLFEQIAYADKMAKTDDSKVTRKDLVDLVKSVIKLLGDKCVEPAFAEEKKAEAVQPQAENSVKKLAKGVSKKQKSMEETATEVSESEETAETEEAPATEEKAEKVDSKKSAKKSTGGKKAPSKNSDTDLKEAVQYFPDTLTVGDTKYAIAHDIASMDDLYNALENDEEIVFAFYWSKAMLKKYPYFYNMLGKPKSFDNDLDLATTIYVSEEKKIAYHISMYTEGCYNTLPEDFEEVEGIRYAGSSEFQIYRAV